MLFTAVGKNAGAGFSAPARHRHAVPANVVSRSREALVFALATRCIDLEKAAVSEGIELLSK
jgi:hypothetical protein